MNCSSKHRWKLRRTGLVLLSVLLMILPTVMCRADNLSSSEVAAISLGSAGLLGLGFWANHKSANRRQLLGGPLLLDGPVQDWLAGDCQEDRTNFLDGTRGSAYTPVGGAVLLMLADLTQPQDDHPRLAGQDIFLYSSGLVATKGITSIAKGLVCRSRPRTQGCAPDDADNEGNRSFFSGHTGSAFFSTAFVNLRTRFLMRREMTSAEYRRWRFGPPLLLFGWASVVGLSRVQACQHYFSDVVAGAVVGVLMAELFYSFDKTNKQASMTDRTTGQLFRVTIRF